MFAQHAAVVNGYLDRRLDKVSRELQSARQRQDSLERQTRVPPDLFSRGFGWTSYTRALMYGTLCIRSYRAPMIVFVSLLLIAVTEARVPKKQHVVGGKARLMRHVPSPLPSEMVDFSKRVYSAMGKHNTTLVASEFRSQFDELNRRTDGELAKTLGAVFEVRLLDLQQSVRHARAMLDVINELSDAATGCVLCPPKKTNESAI
jgi:hypothetical protein